MEKRSVIRSGEKMTTLSGILYAGKSALSAQQVAINTTGNNIANADTTGYCRQTAALSSNDPLRTSAGFVGTGVNVGDITRAQNSYLEKRIVAENGNVGRWDALAQALNEVESLFTESDDYGLTKALSEFWDGWADLADNASGTAERSTLVADAQNLADVFNDLASGLEDVQREMDAGIEGDVDRVNAIAAQVADLNQQIAGAEMNGQTAATYRDTRDSLLEELSGLIDISYYESDNGMVTVQVAGTGSLVEGATASSLSTEKNPSSGNLDIVLTGSDGGGKVITDKISGGSLKGQVEARDDYVEGYLDSLNTLASAVMEQVNTLHADSYGLDGSTGYPFFTGTSAADMAVNQDIVDDNGKIAASGTSDGIPGDNATALSIAALRESSTTNGDTATFTDYYSSLVGDVGTDVERANSNQDYHTDVATSLDNLRQSVSGVSIDEETVNLVMYQSAYDAAAKLISVVKEMLDTLINDM